MGRPTPNQATLFCRAKESSKLSKGDQCLSLISRTILGKSTYSEEDSEQQPSTLGDYRYYLKRSHRWDSNTTRKAYSCRLERFTIGTKHGPMSNPIISFGPSDLEGITTPHEDVLVIQITITNYNMVRVFVDSRNFINIIFKEAFN